MKKIKLASVAFNTMLLAAIVFTACQKNNDTPQNDTVTIEETTVANESDAEADVAYNDVFVNVLGVNDEAGLGGNAGVFSGRATSNGDAGRPDGTDSIPRCLKVTVSPASPGAFPKTITLDFGNGCTARDGHTRRGKIITVYTGRMAAPGSKATTRFEEYYVDSVLVQGTHTVENASTSNNRIFKVTVENGKLIRPSGNYMAWNGTRTRTQTEGNGSPNFLQDDVFSITGKGAGTVKRGDKTFQWSSEIIRPVIRTFNCRWATKGQVQITRNNKTSLFDYGDGSCDNKATLTINGNTYSITLR